MANVIMTSATAAMGQQQGNHGRRPGKPFAGKSGDDLAAIACSNMRSVASMIVSICTHKVRRKKNRKPSVWTVSRFVSQAIHLVHAGLRPELKAIRTHETEAEYGCPAEEVAARWFVFLLELQERLDAKEDPQETCAWIEYQVRGVIHPYADGTGRLATALCAWTMLRNQRTIPSYAFWQRSQMHVWLRKDFSEFREFYLKTCFAEAASDKADPPKAAVA
ncbi:hypothetical protein HY631_03565 [Candidatus Uhrbacteria bacterium]|nr:hypothetical protein [Candidatus Uhrbacteria bacterium]